MAEDGLGVALDAALDQLFSKLEESRKRTPSTELRNFVHSNAMDAYRLGIVLHPIIEAARTTPTVPALAVELIVRNVVEATVVCLFVVRNPEDWAVQQALKTSATKWEESFGEATFHVDDYDEDIGLLPSVTKMARQVDDVMYEAFCQLSYLSHPRSAIPYTAAEVAGLALGKTQESIFQLRAEKAVEWYGLAIERLITALDETISREGADD
jgi:hypothetical protein